MRSTGKILGLFGIVFVLVSGGIMFVVWRLTSSVTGGVTRSRDPSAVMSIVGDTIVWTVVPIVAITVAGLAVFFFVLRRIIGADRRLLATGIPATALVLDVRDTGVTINRVNAVLEARLQVTIPGEAPYETSAEVTLGRMSWGALQPGMTVAVKVDPNDRARAAIDWSGNRPGTVSGVPQAASARMARGRAQGVIATPGGAFPIPGVEGAMQASAVRDAADVVAAGERAEGTIQAVSHTGATAGQMVPGIEPEKAGDPMVFGALQVQPKRGAAFAAQGIHRVPKGKLGTLAIGRRVPVSYLPGQPQSATIDWSRV